LAQQDVFMLKITPVQKTAALWGVLGGLGSSWEAETAL
jgi:hypothetical protein